MTTKQALLKGYQAVYEELCKLEAGEARRTSYTKEKLENTLEALETAYINRNTDITELVNIKNKVDAERSKAK